MTDVVVDMMAEVLSILAIMTRNIKQGKGSELLPRGRHTPHSLLFSRKICQEAYGKE